MYKSDVPAIRPWTYSRYGNTPIQGRNRYNCYLVCVHVRGILYTLRVQQYRDLVYRNGHSAWNGTIHTPKRWAVSINGWYEWSCDSRTMRDAINRVIDDLEHDIPQGFINRIDYNERIKRFNNIMHTEG